MLLGLARLIPCSTVSFLELEPRREMVLTDQEVGDVQVPPDDMAALDQGVLGRVLELPAVQLPGPHR